MHTCPRVDDTLSKGEGERAADGADGEDSNDIAQRREAERSKDAHAIVRGLGRRRHGARFAAGRHAHEAVLVPAAEAATVDAHPCEDADRVEVLHARQQDGARVAEPEEEPARRKDQGRDAAGRARRACGGRDLARGGRRVGQGGPALCRR